MRFRPRGPVISTLRGFSSLARVMRSHPSGAGLDRREVVPDAPLARIAAGSTEQRHPGARHRPIRRAPRRATGRLRSTTASRCAHARPRRRPARDGRRQVRRARLRRPCCRRARRAATTSARPTAPHPATRRLVVSASRTGRVEDEQHRGAGQRDQRQQGDLPVPVDGRVNDECRQDADGDRRARVAPDAGQRPERASRGRAGAARARSGRAPRASRGRGCAHPSPRSPPAARAARCGRTIPHPRRAAARARPCRPPPSSRRSGRCRTPRAAGGRARWRWSGARRRMLPAPGRRSLRGPPTCTTAATPPRTTAATAPIATTRRSRARGEPAARAAAAASCSTTASAASPTSSHASRCPSRCAVCRVAPAVVSAFERDASATPDERRHQQHTEKDDRTQPALGQRDERRRARRQARAETLGCR